MPPYGLKDHNCPYKYQKPLEKKDFLNPMKAQVFGRDGGENGEGGKDDESPLDPVDKAPSPGRYIIQAVYQVSRSLHGTCSRNAARHHSNASNSIR